MNIKTKITNLDHQGRGIARIEGKVVFIPNALPDEEVEIEIITTKKNYTIGKVIKYHSLSSLRKEVKCPYYNECGGCDISHLFYNEQIILKKDNLKNILNKYADINIDPDIVASDVEFYYRNKITLKIENGKWGYYRYNSNKLVAIDNCMLVKDSINKIIENKNLFDIKNGEIIIRSNYDDEILINIKIESKLDIDLEILNKKFKIKGIIVNEQIFFGEDYFIEKVGNYLFKVNINSFFQINLNILEKVFKIIGNDQFKNVVDLYCGVGTLGIALNKEKLFGIEVVSASITDAIENTKINKQFNNNYIVGDSSKISEINDRIDLIVIDPPRAGIDSITMNNLIELKANNIIYMSCDSLTLARDLNVLKDKYNVNKIFLLDMFPQTSHVESVVLITRKDR